VSILHRAHFTTSAARLDQLPPPGAPEIGFVGRSNAGKSSAINVLTQQRRLAFSSKTPGRTRLINMFGIPDPLDPERDLGFLVDLPGYGYAKVPKELQAHWQAFIESYFRTRQALNGLVVVMDIRHPLREYDREMLAFAVARELPAHALLTKADKLGRGRQGEILRAVRRELEADFGDRVTVQTFSSESRQGVDEARAVVAGWLGM